MKKIFFMVVGLSILTFTGVAMAAEVNPQLSVNSMSTSQVDSLKILLVSETSSNSHFKSALINSDGLSLTDDQCKALMIKILEMQQLKSQFKANNQDDRCAVRDFQCVKIQEILSVEQYDKFLNLKNKIAATGDAVELWKEMVKRGLTLKLDSVSELEKISIYQLTKRNTRDRYANDNLKVRFELVNIDKSAPISILALYQIRKYDNPLSIKSVFSYALTNQDNLNLTEEQVITLKSKAVQLAKLKIEGIQQGKDNRVSECDYQCVEIQKVLSLNQYEKLLNTKNQKVAESDANELLKDIVQRGLAASSDSSNVYPQIVRYALVKRNARDRYANDKVKLNANLKSIDELMPGSVRTLYTARKRNSTVDNSVKGTFQW